MNNDMRTVGPAHKWFMKGYFPFALIGTETEIRALEEYFGTVEAHIKQQAKDFTLRVDKRAKELGLEGEERDYFYESHEEEYENLHGRYPTIARSSVLILACSRFESALMSVCKDWDGDSLLKNGVALETFGDRGITKASRYLSKNFGLKPSNWKKWGHLQDVFKIRNCFVHADGDISMMRKTGKKDDQAPVREACNRLPGVTIEHGDRIVLTDSFFHFLFPLMLEFWGAFTNACRDNATIGPLYWP